MTGDFSFLELFLECVHLFRSSCIFELFNIPYDHLVLQSFLLNSQKALVCLNCYSVLSYGYYFSISLGVRLFFPLSWALFLAIVFQSLYFFKSLQPHGLQHPCPSLAPEVCSDSCPLSRWCCLTISSSTALFSFCLQSFPASGCFPMNQLFTSGGQHQSLQRIFRVDFL